eukprot:CAMPEP_0198202502 /NCGR_PEP_ID=MMETSP1445-20131203/5671_1 /TAXON_ID=36898 /ORGANISM="Pyramimonas sp., Strain CCMP2087" /LENGTH=322 /DNA_ID=CAMNT_0043873453 /DNA_START=99 /DNA_END=1067 /DNA_ORIENTATION=-
MSTFDIIVLSKGLKDIVTPMLGPFSLLTEEVYDKVPMNYMLVGHCVCMCAMARDNMKAFFLINFWVSFMMGFGGTHYTALLNGQPLPLFTNNLMGVAWTAVWLVMHYCPKDLVYKFSTWYPVQFITKKMSMMCRVGAITANVNFAATKYPGVFIAPLVLGTLAGAGGKLTVDLCAKLLSDKSLVPAGEMASPTYVLRSAFYASLFHAAAVHWLDLMSEKMSYSVLLTVFLTHAVTKELGLGAGESLKGVVASLTAKKEAVHAVSPAAKKVAKTKSPIKSPWGSPAPASMPTTPTPPALSGLTPVATTASRRSNRRATPRYAE